MPQTIGILGKKVGMTRMYSENGSAMGVTVVEAGPCYVLQKKSVAKEGYNAIQVGFSEKKESRVNKPAAGHFKSGGQGSFYHVKEFRVADPEEYELGQKILASDLFKVGDLVDVTGTTKGKGFQGVVRRYGFAGGPKTHGSMFHRRPGSIGCSAWPGRVVKGKKLPGRMGGKVVTKKNLTIIDIREDANVIVLKGSLPGADSGVVQVYTK
ncbi:MAG: 50S ribosomal protein L3 [Thermodesulfobacteriota bacterium]